MKRHRVDPLSLVAGLFFSAVAVLHLMRGLDADLLRLRWLGAAAFIGLGLAVMLRPGSRAADPDTPSGPDGEPDL